MNDSHVSDEHLLDFQFRLLADAAEHEVKDHLDGCHECRQRLDDLDKKIAQLDLLQDEQLPSATILRRTKGLAHKGKHAKALPPALPWLWAAAALLVLGLCWWFLVPDQKTTEPATVEFPSWNETLPFAPGSNIELNVLPRRDDVQLTIYNGADLTLVRERRRLTMKKGWNWLQFMWANTLIDPTSLELRPVDREGSIDVVQLVFPPRLKDVGRWLVKSDISGPVECEITYFTSGISWRAFYMGTLTPDEKNMRLQGYVRVTNNSGEPYDDAEVRLIVGKVHILDQIASLARRAHPYGRPHRQPQQGPRPAPSMDMDRAELMSRARRGLPRKREQKKIKKEGLSEYFLYTIEGTETIPNQWSKRLPSFEVAAVPVVNLYKYEEERYGKLCVRFLNFKNDKEHKLGNEPIPGGLLKVYRRVDDQKHLSYEGQSSFKYIPVGEDVELNLGHVSDVIVKPTMMLYKTDQFTYNDSRNIDGWDETRLFRIEVNNTRKIPVKVEITRNFPHQYWYLERDGEVGEYRKIDLDTARFTLMLDARDKQEFNYTLTRHEGRRREQ